MAQLVKLEPGDILVLANVGDTFADGDGDFIERLASTLRELGVERILVFEGNVDLSKVPSDAVAGS